MLILGISLGRFDFWDRSGRQHWKGKVYFGRLAKFQKVEIGVFPWLYIMRKDDVLSSIESGIEIIRKI